jgi:hypothetical protein
MQSGDDTYAAAPPVEQTLTVTKVMLTVTADDKEKEYQAPLPVLSFVIEGLLSGDDESMLDVLPMAATTADASSPVGVYPITVAGGSDANYDFTMCLVSLPLLR